METDPDSTNGERGEAAAGSAARSLRRSLIAVLYASGAFFLLLLLGDFLPPLVYLGCIVFLLVGLWVGRHSCRPWIEGAVYGGLAALVAAVLIALVTALGWLGWLIGLFLALPQGVVGVWLGARFLRRRG